MLDRVSFGELPGGAVVDLFTLKRPNGFEVRVISFGGAVTSLLTPDRRGRFADIVLGCDTLAEYLGQPAYFGAIVGRYANRIADGCFAMNGREFRLATNANGQHLHGGIKGFDKVVWDAEPFEDAARSGLKLSRTSPDGEEGYPGTVSLEVTYLLEDDLRLSVEYRATTDAPTPLTLSQHSYFNLAGHDQGLVLDHQLRLHADRYTPVNEHLIPTGQMAPVTHTPFDFREPATIGARIDEGHEQLRLAGGYDHNFVLNRDGSPEDALLPAADLFEPRSGRTLGVFTTEPGVQFYTGNFLDGTVRGKGGYYYVRRSGLCLETQHFPDSPNRPAFPPAILGPDRPYHSRTVFQFGVRE